MTYPVLSDKNVYMLTYPVMSDHTLPHVLTYPVLSDYALLGGEGITGGLKPPSSEKNRPIPPSNALD